MNIFKHEFRMNFRSVVSWSVAIFILLVFYMAVFNSIAVDAQIWDEMMARFPEELLIAFGMNEMDLSSVLGFFAIVFLFCQICLAVQAANYGFSILSIEEREFTADFLLAKPVKRTTILTSKLLSALAGLTITNAVVWLASFLVVFLFRDGRPVDTTALILLLLSVAVFQLFFLSVGMVVSLLVKRVRSVTPFSMGLAFGMYALNAFGGMLGEVSFEIITPFKHFDPNYIIRNGSYDMPLALLSVLVIVVSIGGSYWLYARRDIRSAV
jgi:ABC-2 type transport system permease protein